MKSVLAAAMIAACCAGSALADDAKRLVTIVTSDHPQTQLMSMVLTMQSIRQGAEANILLCGRAGDLALKAAPEAATAPQAPMGMSPQGLMQKIMGAGGAVEVCALYLPNKGVGAEALLDGVGAAKPPEMAARLLDDQATILSF
ncbi:MAG: hypothetical protein AAGM38_02190 [Pseudomonadota bacterium]